MTGVSIPGAGGVLAQAQEAEDLRKAGKLAHLPSSYKMVDTCAGEFKALTPYFYGSYDKANEAEEFLAAQDSQNCVMGHQTKGRILVLGSGPIRIGQGIEFDYASVQCVAHYTTNQLGLKLSLSSFSFSSKICCKLYHKPTRFETNMYFVSAIELDKVANYTTNQLGLKQEVLPPLKA